MNKKIALSSFIVIILLLFNITTINAKINNKKETNNNQDINDISSSEKNNNGLAKGKFKDKNPNSDPIYEINLNVFYDYSCSKPASNVNWGEIEIGGSQSIILYMKNSGNIDSVASLSTDSWYPEVAYEYMSLGWDYDGHLLTPGEVLPVTFTLEISPECPTMDSFNFDIVVVGS